MPLNSQNTDIIWATKQQVLVKTSPRLLPAQRPLSALAKAASSSRCPGRGALQRLLGWHHFPCKAQPRWSPLHTPALGFPVTSQLAHCVTSPTSLEPRAAQLGFHELPASVHVTDTHIGHWQIPRCTSFIYERIYASQLPDPAAISLKRMQAAFN